MGNNAVARAPIFHLFEDAFDQKLAAIGLDDAGIVPAFPVADENVLAQVGLFQILLRRVIISTVSRATWKSVNFCADGYLLGSYRIATAPEANSSRLTSLKSTGFDSPANNVGPWPASLGCTTNSYSSIKPSSANASGSFTPPTSSPLPDSRLSC